MILKQIPIVLGVPIFSFAVPPSVAGTTTAATVFASIVPKFTFIFGDLWSSDAEFRESEPIGRQRVALP